MKTLVTKSIFDIDPEAIPKIRKPAYSSYDNKPLKKWDADDFARYILDNSSAKGVVYENYFTPFLNEYLTFIPELKHKFERVFLYGVYSVISPCLKKKQ
jgi:hypothetical protein